MESKECYLCHRIGYRGFVGYGDWAWCCYRDDLCRKTYCHNGHAFSDENTYRPPGGTRKCKTCQYERHAAWVAKKKEQAS